MKLKKPLSTVHIQSQKIERIPFSGRFEDAFGRPQNRGAWFICGGTTSGKSSFAMQLAYEFGQYYKVLYNLLEEEPDDADYIERTEKWGMEHLGSNFQTVSYNLEELDFYLSNQKRNKSQVVFVDSLPYFTKSYDEYLAFKKKWANKVILVFIGHADGKNPSTEMQKRVMFDVKMKLMVSGYLVVCKGRTIGKNGGLFVVWKEGYEKLRGEEPQKTIAS